MRKTQEMDDARVRGGGWRRLAIRAAVLGVMALPFLGPMAIHALHRAATWQSEIELKRSEYARLSALAARREGPTREMCEAELRKISLWFQVRGYEVGEGRETEPLWQPWSEVILYYRLAAEPLADDYPFGGM